MATSFADAGANARSEPRDEVYHRARAMRAAGDGLSLTVVNISPHGLMARCETEPAAGERIGVMLPVVGRVRAEVRWALGGRIGCRIEPAIPVTRYYEVLAALRR